MKLYLDLDNVSAIPDAWQHRSDDLMRLSGINLGNFAFRHALRTVLADLSAFDPVGYSNYSARTTDEAPEHLIVSCANWLGTGEKVDHNNGFRADMLARAKRVTALGLGVQAPQGAERLELGPQTRRMVEVMAERGPLISVRDEVTARTLADIGVETTQVTGCPSNFISPDAELGANVIKRAEARAEGQPGWEDLRVLVSEASGGHGKSQAVIAAYLEMMARGPVAYILQGPPLLPFVLGETGTVPEFYVESSERSETEVRRLLRRTSVHFSSMEAWLDYARTCQMALGMRIHGTMVPLQTGVPSLLIRHDSRTAGLANVMAVPAITPEEYMDLLQERPAAIYTRIARDMEGYDKRRRELAQGMLGYLQAHQLAPHAALEGLTH